MNQDAANKILEEALTAGYAGPIKIIRNNAPTSRQPESSRFLMFYIDPIGTQKPFLGTKSRRVGLIVMELFVPLGEGDRTALVEAEVFGDIFSDKDLSGVMCYSSNIKVVGAATLENEDIRRFKIAITVPYYYDRN